MSPPPPPKDSMRELVQQCDDQSKTTTIFHNPKIFEDKLLQTLELPRVVNDLEIADADIILAVRLIYQGQNLNNNISTIIKLLCSLAYSQLRCPENLEDRIFNKYDANIKYPGGKIVESKTESMLALSFLAGMSGKEEETEDKKATKDVEIEKLKKEVVTIRTNIEDAYKKLSSESQPEDENEIPFEGKTTLTIEEKTYIGAWAYYHLRCFAKEAVSMRGMQIAEKKVNRMNSLINRLYDIDIGPNFLKPLSESAYTRLNQNMGRSNYLKGMIIRSLSIQLLVNSDDNKEAPVNSVLTGLLMMIALKHAIPVYTWTEQLSNRSGYQPITVLNHMYRANITGASVLKAIKFYYTYAFTQAEFDELSADLKKKLNAKYIGGNYFPIARIINPNYLTEVARKGNSPLVTALYTATIMLDNEEKNNADITSRYVVDPGYKCDIAKEQGRLYAKVVKTLASQSPLHEIYNLVKKDADPSEVNNPGVEDDEDDPENVK